MSCGKLQQAGGELGELEAPQQAQAALQLALAALDERGRLFEIEQGRRAVSADIFADTAYAVLHAAVKAAECAAAKLPPKCGCQQYIARRRRYCTLRAQTGEKFCSQHAADAESAARLLTGGHGSTVALSHTQPAGGRVKTNIGRRMKSMTDPLARPTPLAAPPAWCALLEPATGPVLVDVGCAKGRFVQALAASSESRHPRAQTAAAACARLLTPDEAGGDGDGGEHWRFVGVEIFRQLAEAAQEWAAARTERSAAFVCANAGLNEGAELARVCEGLDVRCLCLQFPDPWGALLKL
ncbi:hypothetical protein T492DRAFT_847621 [Pavlovales sp. CCMP2436]|nr:hypothetical protein T492DRAFT_847621 [Pavlovales sp. CCMP2436]